jgi:putative ABC transport system permease protein
MMDGDKEMSRTSKLETLEELNNAKMVLYILGGGIALIIALIGILNFVNVMSVGIMVRRHELATLEAVGMSRKQVRKLLVSEGLGYAVMTLLLVFTIGTLMIFSIFSLFRQQATYAVFIYPFAPAILISLVIIAVCVITPEIAYRSIHKSTVVDRLRETE